MELRSLKYFLAVANAGNVTKAAGELHVSQPALSMQLANLEEELGHRLFERSARGIALTERGMMLKRRAEDLVRLAGRVEAEVRGGGEEGIAGTVAIGAGETPGFALVARALAELRAENPLMGVELASGNAEDITRRIEEGTLDLGVFVGPGRYKGYDYINLPHEHKWGLLVRKDHPLAGKSRVGAVDMRGLALLRSRQSMLGDFLSGWLGYDSRELNVTGTYNLLYNAAVMVDAGLGAAVCIDGLTPAALSERVTFRPFSPALKSDIYLGWKGNRELPAAARALVERVRGILERKEKNKKKKEEQE